MNDSLTAADAAGPDASAIALMVVAAMAVAGVVAWWVSSRSLRRRVAEAELAAGENARNAEVASMTRGLAHEIKNPLSTVALNAQLLREEILDSPLADDDRARMTRRVDTLAREAARLRDILTDFLRYAGRMQLDRRACDLRDVAQELADFFMPQAEQSGVRFVVRADEDPLRADVDPALLKQALLNLLLNGVQAMQDLPEDRPRTLTLRARLPDGHHTPAVSRQRGGQVAQISAFEHAADDGDDRVETFDGSRRRVDVGGLRIVDEPHALDGASRLHHVRQPVEALQGALHPGGTRPGQVRDGARRNHIAPLVRTGHLHRMQRHEHCLGTVLCAVPDGAVAHEDRCALRGLLPVAHDLCT